MILRKIKLFYIHYFLFIWAITSNFGTYPSFIKKIKQCSKNKDMGRNLDHKAYSQHSLWRNYDYDYSPFATSFLKLSPSCEHRCSMLSFFNIQRNLYQVFPYLKRVFTSSGLSIFEVRNHYNYFNTFFST